MIESSKKAKTFDFQEYAYSVQVVKDYPRLIAVMEKLIPVLEQYQNYTAAWNVLQAAHDSKVLLEVHLKYYEHVFNKKGELKE